ncbi:MAG: MFS transporter, partial [Verrucomicrobiaceae bacterium]|nr:MFS transporter [Verrucomicrobiaceae bacterium]
MGDWRTAFIGLAVAVVAYVGYGLASSGWMVFIVIAIGSLGGLAGPAVQSLISNSVGDDEQGTMQGAITSLESISGIIGPLIATQLFSHFIDAKRTVQ